jgi:hypothetical protein
MVVGGLKCVAIEAIRACLEVDAIERYARSCDKRGSKFKSGHSLTEVYMRSAHHLHVTSDLL